MWTCSTEKLEVPWPFAVAEPTQVLLRWQVAPSNMVKQLLPRKWCNRPPVPAVPVQPRGYFPALPQESTSAPLSAPPAMEQMLHVSQVSHTIFQGYMVQFANVPSQFSGVVQSLALGQSALLGRNPVLEKAAISAVSCQVFQVFTPDIYLIPNGGHGCI